MHTTKANGSLSTAATLPLLRGYAAIGLINPKTTANVGSVLRLAGNFGAGMVVCAGARNRYRPAPTDTMKSYRHIPLLCVEDAHDVIPYDCVPVAVDLVEGARPITTYRHPERAFYLFGPEDGTLGSGITGWCRDAIYVPTHRCMNLAMTVAVVMYDRLQKQLTS